MSQPDENRPPHPGFEQPEGATPFADEQTLPFVDLYTPSDTMGGNSPYGADASQRSAGPYAGSYGGGQYPPQGYPPQQYATPHYDPNLYDPNLYGPNPQRYAMAPQQQYGYYAYAPAEHPQSTAVLVLAVLGFAQPITPFIAWYMGNKARAEIRRGAPYAYTGSLKVGHIIGKVLSILMIAGIAGYMLLMVLLVVGAMAF